MLCNPKMCINRSNELHDIFTDGNGWHSEYLAFGSDEQPAKTAVKFGTIRDLLWVNNLLLFPCYEVDNLEFMACLQLPWNREMNQPLSMTQCFLRLCMACPVTLRFRQCFSLTFIFSNPYHSTDRCLGSLTQKQWRKTKQSKANQNAKKKKKKKNLNLWKNIFCSLQFYTSEGLRSEDNFNSRFQFKEVKIFLNILTARTKELIKFIKKKY